MTVPFHVIIPARYQSTRFPAKLMQELGGMTVIERVYRQALLAEPQSVIIATDHDAIAEHAQNFGASVIMTSLHHPSGTDRIGEVVAKGSFSAQDIIVNVQGDEPFIAPELIRQVAYSLSGSSAPVATLCWPIESKELFHNPNVVKVVRTSDDYALYFSRAPIPAYRDEPDAYKHALRHIGLYAYRAAFLLDFVGWPASELEQLEALEQLRILWSGYRIKVEQACLKPLQDINTRDDLILAQQSLMTLASQ
jgi:3-deoxy-manno-octulosonate cytidylyltransferase (CMP-KDO synthetase)